MMKKLFTVLFVALGLSFAVSAFASPNDEALTLTLNNQYPKTLLFVFHNTSIPPISIKSNQQKTVPVPKQAKEIYISAIAGQEASAYFGLTGMLSNNLTVHGYLDTNVYYDWQSGQHAEITFHD